MLKPLDDYSKILVRVPNALGDAVMATPFLRRLAALAGAERVTLCGPRSALEVLGGAPWFASAIEEDRRGQHRGIFGVSRFARQLARERFELALLLPNSMRTALTARLAGIPSRVGYYKELRRFMLTAGMERDKDARGKFVPKYTGRYFDQLLDLFPGTPAGKMRPELFVEKKGEEEFRTWAEMSGYDSSRPLLILVPGAAYGPSKIWIPERYAMVVDRLVEEKNAQLLISYGPGEEGIVTKVRKHLRTQPLADARMSISGLKSIYKRAAFVLTNDTGPRHLAVAFGVPHVTIMGPNDPRYTHLDNDAGEVIRVDVKCSPCQLKVCPLEEQVCMTELATNDVVERCLAGWPRENVSQGL